MSFRDDADAARARADALSRELAHKDAELERLREQLARRDEEDEQEDAEEAAAAREAEAEAEAESKLRALRERNAKHRQDKEQRETRARKEADDEASREAERRCLASVSVVGDIDPTDIAPLVLIPTMIGMVWTAIRWGGLAILVPLSAVCLVYGLRYFGREHARRLYREQELWARSLPFALEGYPELLDRKPRWMMGGSVMRLDDPSEHRFVQVELEFRGGKLPARLDEMMTGFDPDLDMGGAENDRRVHRMFHALRGDEEPKKRADVFHRSSPVTTTRSKGGSTRVEDHNRAVRDWVHRLVRECLQPLHAKHGLVRVVVRLR